MLDQYDQKDYHRYEGDDLAVIDMDRLIDTVADPYGGGTI